MADSESSSLNITIFPNEFHWSWVIKFQNYNNAYGISLILSHQVLKWQYVLRNFNDSESSSVRMSIYPKEFQWFRVVKFLYYKISSGILMILSHQVSKSTYFLRNFNDYESSSLTITIFPMEFQWLWVIKFPNDNISYGFSMILSHQLVKWQYFLRNFNDFESSSLNMTIFHRFGVMSFETISYSAWKYSAFRDAIREALW